MDIEMKTELATLLLRDIGRAVTDESLARVLAAFEAVAPVTTKRGAKEVPAVTSDE